MSEPHIPDELTASVVVVKTKYGELKGGRTKNGAAVFLEVPYALPPKRFHDPQPLPADYKYEEKCYVSETKHCYQPTLSDVMPGISTKDLLGYGDPSEDPLFLNIVAPSSFSHTSKFPVKVYIHGGYLQYGSPHDLHSQAQYVAQERSEVWVNIGYRLSVLGFLACDEPKIDGNFGFKDQWLGLLWVRDNIAAFGGDPDNIQVTGLSAGAHSVHQILHHISRLPAEEKSPVRSARLESNAIMTTPKTAKELRPQFEALCDALKLDPKSPDILDVLRDPQRVPPEQLMYVIGTSAVRVPYGTFRGCLDGTWMATNPDPMTWQRNGDFGRKLLEKGVKSVVVGNVMDEWYHYGTANPTSIDSPADIQPNLLRYYPQSIVNALVSKYPPLPHQATPEESQRMFGTILADSQVNIPCRLLARDLQRVGLPVLQYEICWTPERYRIGGYVTHSTDRILWALRIPSFTLCQKEVALKWLHKVDEEIGKLEQYGPSGRLNDGPLTLMKDLSITGLPDARLKYFLEIARVLPGE